MEQVLLNLVLLHLLNHSEDRRLEGPKVLFQTCDPLGVHRHGPLDLGNLPRVVEAQPQRGHRGHFRKLALRSRLVQINLSEEYLLDSFRLTQDEHELGAKTISRLLLDLRSTHSDRMRSNFQVALRFRCATRTVQQLLALQNELDVVPHHWRGDLSHGVEHASIPQCSWVALHMLCCQPDRQQHGPQQPPRTSTHSCGFPKLCKYFCNFVRK